MYNKPASLNSRHKIILDRLTCHENQSINLIGSIVKCLESKFSYMYLCNPFPQGQFFKQSLTSCNSEFSFS